MPSAAASPASSTTAAERPSRSTPGMAAIGARPLEPVLDEERQHEVGGLQARLADEVAQVRGARAGGAGGSAG